MTVSPDDEEFAPDATQEVSPDAPEDDVAEQRQALSEPPDSEGVDADERVVDLDEDEYR